MTTIASKLKELDIHLPPIAQSIANYMPFCRMGNQVIISGQLPVIDGVLQYKGSVGLDLDIEEGQKAARLCGINILAALNSACDGDLDKVIQCVRLGGFVQAPLSFTDHPKVINGASDLMVEVFGDKGRHARAALGVSSLPLGASVEVEATFLVS